MVRETVPRWVVAKYRPLYTNTLDARHFGAMFSEERNSTMFDRPVTRPDTDIGAWSRRWGMGSSVPV